MAKITTPVALVNYYTADPIYTNSVVYLQRVCTAVYFPKVQDEFGNSLAPRETTSNNAFNWGS